MQRHSRIADVDGGVEVLPPSGFMIFSVVKKPVDNEEFETESYTLTDDKGNVISLTYEKNRELSFTMIDYLAFSPKDLETMGMPQELYDSMMEGIANATKQHGTLLSFYEIQVENDDGFLIHEGPFYIKIKMTDEMKKYDIFKIVYTDTEDNFATESPITLTLEGGYLVGTLEHLSTYALVGDNAPSAPTYTVSFDANGGTGTMVDVTGISGEYTLPENGFTAPDGKQFKSWSVGGVEKAVGDKINVTADTTVTAVWEDVPAGHIHNLKPVAKVEPSCTEGGKNAYYKCDGCGKFFEDALGAKEITNLANWGNIDKLGHTPSDWKSDKDNHWKECNRTACGAIIENSKAAHIDENKDGKCDVCVYEVGVPIDPDDNKPSDNPETGDNGNLGLWMILSVLSCCSMIALIVIDKKRKIAK